MHEVQKRPREQLEAREAERAVPRPDSLEETTRERRHAQQIEREREEAVELGGRLLAIDVQPNLLPTVDSVSSSSDPVGGSRG